MHKVKTSKKQLDLLRSQWVVEINGYVYGPIPFDKIEQFESLGKIMMLKSREKLIKKWLEAQRANA